MDNPSDDGQAAVTSTSGTPPEAVGKALPTGARIAEFEIIRVLGEGGFGLVYLAFDQLLHRHVAIKEYFPSSYAVRRDAQTITALSPSHEETYRAGMASFIEEARLLARFEHPALVKVLRYWESNGTAYMVMPHYQGRTLKDLLKSGDAFSTEAELRTLMSPLLEAVAVMHDEQCFHRDISPENVIIRPSGAPVLLDFGAARRILGDSTKALTVVLKQNYAPIEQYSDDGAMPQGPWTDIYALSAMMFTAIMRKPPPSAVARVYQDPVKPLAKSGLPGFTTRFLHGVDVGMAVRPEDRPRTIAAFREALGLDGGAAHAVPAGVKAPEPAAPAAPVPATAKPAPLAPAPAPAAPQPAPVKPAPTPAPAEPRAIAATDLASSTLDKARVVVGPDSRYVPPTPAKPGASRTAVIAGLGLLVALAAGGAWYAMTQRGSDSPKVAVGVTPAAPAPSEPAKPAVSESPKAAEAAAVPSPAPAAPAPAAAAEAAPAPTATTPAPSVQPPPAATAPAPAPPAATPPVTAPSATPAAAPAGKVSAAPPAKEKEKEREKAQPKSAAADKGPAEKGAPPTPATSAKPAAPAVPAPPPVAPAAEPPRAAAAEDDAPRDLSEEGRKLFTAANRGDANAQVALARLYAQGKGAPQSDAEAARWIRKAAEQGNTEAWHAMGVLYEGGRGVAKDPAEAAKWYRRAAERGNPVSQNNLGAMYASGTGVPKDDAEAVAWYRKAAEQGNARGQYNLAMKYLAGQGVAKDEAEAARLLRRAADQGLASAQFELGAVYASGRGVMKDEAEAVVWYRKAAAQGNAQAAERVKQLEPAGR
ncbi:MAG: serine/threonine-protein kinase [Burkholderiales bacterium]